MWDDLPKRKNTGTKLLIIFLVIATLGALGYAGYILFGPNNNSEKETTPTPLGNIKTSGSPIVSPSILTSPSPMTSPGPSGTPDYKIPTGETYVSSSVAETSGDNKDETLVITKMATGKYHLYILSSEGKMLWENKELDRKPVRIATQTYDASKETFLSWMLIFTENSGDLVFIHWNGTQYEIPQNELGL